MRSTGMSRKIDDLGRIVLPVEMRRHLGIREGTHLDIRLEDDRIVLTRARSECTFCGAGENLGVYRDRAVCGTCARELGGLDGTGNGNTAEPPSRGVT